MKSNTKKVLTTVSLTAGFSAIAGLAVALSLVHEQKEVVYNFVKSNNIYEVLKAQSDRLQTKAQSESLTPQQKANYDNMINYANQLLKNKNASIKSMVALKNDMQFTEALDNVLNHNKDDDEINNSFNELKTFIKDTDFKNKLDTVFEDYKTSQQEDAKEVFTKQVNDLRNQQKDSINELESGIFTILENDIRFASLLKSKDLENRVLNTNQKLRNTLNSETLSNDTMQELALIFENTFNSSSQVQNKNYAQISSLMVQYQNKLNNVIDLIESSAIDDDNKKELTNQVNELKQNIFNFKALETLSSIGIEESLDEYVNNLYSEIENNFLNKEQLKNKYKEQILKIQNLQENSNPEIIKFTSKLLEKYNINEDDTKEDLLSKVSGIQKDSIDLFLLKSLVKKTNDIFSLNNSLKTFDNDRQNTLNNSLLEAQNSNDIEDALQKYSALYLNVESNSNLVNNLKSALKELKQQVEYSIDNHEFNGLNNQIKKDLESLKSDIDLALATAMPVEGVISKFKELSEKERLINKQELSNLINNSDNFLSKTVLDETRNNFTKLIENSKPLVDAFSGATREQLQFKIKEFKQQEEKIVIENSNNANENLASQVIKTVKNVFGEQRNETKESLIKNLEELETKARLVKEDSSLSFAEKQEQLNEINTTINAIKDRVEDYHDLDTLIPEANDLVAGLDEDTKQALSREVKLINALVEQANIDFKNPNTSDPQGTKEKLQKAINDLKEAKIQYNLNRVYKPAVDKTNDSFGPYRVNNADTPLEQKILSQLKELRDEYLNSETTDQRRKKIEEKIQKISESAESAALLEDQANKLASVIEKAELIKNNKPTKEIENSRENLQKAKDLIAKANEDGITSPEDYNKLTETLKQSKKDLDIAISLSKLHTEADELSKSLYKGEDSNISPYKNVNDAIQNLLNQRTQIVNTPKQNLTQEQVDSLTEKIEKQQKLAKKLNEALLKLKTIDPAENSIAYNSLKTVIENSIINEADATSDIQSKISKLNLAIERSQVIIDSEKSVDELSKVYTDEDRKKAIFADNIAATDEKLEQFKEILKNPESSLSALKVMKTKAEQETRKQKEAKEEIQTQFDKTKSSIEEKYQNLVNDAKSDNIVDENNEAALPKLKDLWEKYNEIKSNNATTQQQLDEILQKMDLAAKKDTFNFKKAKLEKEISKLADRQDPLADEIKQKMSDAVIALSKSVENESDSSSKGVQNVADKVKKLADLNSLLTKQNEALDRINELKAKPANDALVSPEALEKAIKDNYPSDSDTAKELETKIQNLGSKIIDSFSLEDSKNREKERISQSKEIFDNSVSDSLDPEFKSTIDSLFNNLSEENKAASSVTEVKEIDKKLDELNKKYEESRQLAKTVKDASTAVSNLPTDSEQLSPAEARIKELINTQITESQQMYGDLTIQDSEISDKKDTLNLLIEQLRRASNIKGSKDMLLEKLDLLTYPAGTGNFGEPSDRKEGFKKYITQLYNQSQDPNIKIEETTRITIEFDKIDKLLDAQKTKIAEQTTMLNTQGYSSHSWNYEIDAKNFADAILKSIPKFEVTNDKLKESNLKALKETLETSTSQINEVFVNRKEVMDFINGETTGLVDKVTESLKDTATSQTDEKYQLLKTKLETFFNKQSQEVNDLNFADLRQQNHTISEYENILEIISNHRKDANTIFSNLNIYKNIADSVKHAKDEIAKIESESDLNSNRVMQKEIARLNEQETGLIDKSEKMYANLNDSRVVLNQQVTKIETQVAKLYLVKAYYLKAKEIESNNVLEAAEKRPLNDILVTAFQEIQRNSSLNSADGFNALRVKYIDGSGSFSVSRAMENSLKLHNIIEEARTWQASDSSRENAKMKEYYKKLNQYIDKAIVDNSTIPSQYQRDNQLQTKDIAIQSINSNKEEIISKISDSFTGIIALIKKEKTVELNEQYTRANSLLNFIKTQFNLVSGTNNVSPLMPNFESDAVTPLNNINISSGQVLDDYNSKLATSKDLYKQQIIKLFTWQKNHLTSVANKLKKYIDLLKDGVTGNSDNLAPEMIALYQKITGTTNEELDSWNNTVAQALEAANIDPSDFRYLDNYRVEFLSIFKSKIDIISDIYQTLKSNSTAKMIQGKEQYTGFKAQFEDLSSSQDDSSANQIRNVLKLINKFNGTLQSNIENFLRDYPQLESLENNLTDNEESNIDYNVETHQDIEEQRKNTFNSYRDYAKTLVNIDNILNKILFGDSLDENSSLKHIFNDYIDKRTNFEQMLGFVANNQEPFNKFDTDNLDSNPYFAAINKAYFVQTSTAKAIQNDINTQLNLNTQSVPAELDLSTKAFKVIKNLRAWLLQKANLQYFFNFLRQNVNGQKYQNYDNIVTLDSSLTETFLQKLNEIPVSENTFTKNDKTYQYKVLNGQNGLLDLFKEFNILKTSSGLPLPYNLDNVKVYVYAEKPSSGNAEFAKVYLQSDTSIKKVALNLRFVYEPTAQQHDTEFNDVPSFEYDFENILVTFKTYDWMRVRKANFEGASDQAIQNNMTTSGLFSMNEAGWNKYTIVPNYLAAFMKNSFYELKTRGIGSFSDNATVSVDDADQKNPNNNASSPSFRVKFEYNDNFVYTFNGTNYKQYARSDGSKFVYWAPMETKLEIEGTKYKYSYYIDLAVPMVSTTDNTKFIIINLHQLFKGEVDTASDENFKITMGYGVNTSDQGQEGSEFRVVYPDFDSSPSAKTVEGTSISVNTSLTQEFLNNSYKQAQQWGLENNLPEAFARKLASSLTGRADRLGYVWDTRFLTETSKRWFNGAVSGQTDSGMYPGTVDFATKIKKFDIKLKLH
ncbi:hypothetical protein [[Mycoplasma] gypis]|uniref:ECM-binding protein homolog n=1 Tax=[Mycoplasma] gypis TaxID=92404 RepID=A0ABZ2RMR3_9BACT|nr:hypothetical protein [[Mycoplasma] gypis]MBN0919542.1 hypothetical protein [[Mycoplasma] gypis]